MKTLYFPSRHGATARNQAAGPRRQNRKPKQPSGSVTERYPIILDDGKTVIWITDRSKEREIRERYAS